MKKIHSLLLCLALLLSLAACGSATMADSNSAVQEAPGLSFDSMAESAADSNGFDYWSTFDSKTPAEAPTTASGGSAITSSLPENVKMIYRGYLYLESTAFDTAVSGLQALVAELGGYFESSELSNYSPYRSASYVVRIPSGSYSDFCSRVGTLAQVNTQRHTSENVSEAYYDTESRLVTQRTKLERLQELLSQADKMEDIITLESAIAETELQIEQLTGTLRKYDALVDYATVELYLDEVANLSQQEQPAVGFWAQLSEAFRRGTSNFVDDVQRSALRFARNWVEKLIWLVIWVVVIVLVVRWLRRHKGVPFFRRKKKMQAPPETPSETPSASRQTKE